MKAVKEKKSYQAPELTVVSFKAERGYALSVATLDSERHLFEYDYADPHVTQYESDDSWAGYSWN